MLYMMNTYNVSLYHKKKHIYQQELRPTLSFIHWFYKSKGTIQIKFSTSFIKPTFSFGFINQWPIHLKTWPIKSQNGSLNIVFGGPGPIRQKSFQNTASTQRGRGWVPKYHIPTTKRQWVWVHSWQYSSYNYEFKA